MTSTRADARKAFRPVPLWHGTAAAFTSAAVAGAAFMAHPDGEK